MDPVTAIAAATTAFNVIKKGFDMGRDIESMYGDMGRWMGAVSDVNQANKMAKNPPLFKKLFAGSSIEEDAINAYLEVLFPQAEIVTPNIYEAKLLTNIDINNEQDIEHAGEVILNLGVKAVLIKGGGIRDLSGKDFFIDNKGNKKWLSHKFIKTQNTHGSGCTLSAALCGYRALRLKTIDSIKQSKLFVEKSLDNSYQIGFGPGPLGHH